MIYQRHQSTISTKIIIARVISPMFSRRKDMTKFGRIGAVLRSIPEALCFVRKDFLAGMAEARTFCRKDLCHSWEKIRNLHWTQRPHNNQTNPIASVEETPPYHRKSLNVTIPLLCRPIIIIIAIATKTGQLFPSIHRKKNDFKFIFYRFW